MSAETVEGFFTWYFCDHKPTSFSTVSCLLRNWLATRGILDAPRWPSAVHARLQSLHEGLLRTTEAEPKQKPAASVGQVRGALRSKTGGRLGQLLTCTGFLGLLRVSELCKLRWKHVTFSRASRMVSLELYDTKTSKGRGGNRQFITLPRIKGFEDIDGYELLLAWKTDSSHSQPDDPVFQETGAPLSPHRANFLINASLGGGTREFTAHSCRSGGKTWLEECGVSTEIIMRHGRWRSANSAELYSRNTLLQRERIWKQYA